MSQIRTLLVLCDVGPAHGIGHLMRCLALAEEFASRGFEVIFSADVESVPFAKEQLTARGFRWVAPPGPAVEAVEQAAAVGATVVVVDSYVRPLETYTALRRARPTLAIVDGDPAGRDGDIILDQNIGAEDDEWPLPPGTVRLAGLEHALIRDEIRDARSDDRSEEHAPLRVFAFFGGTDAFGAAPVVTAALVDTGRSFDLRVVGATSELRAELAAVEPQPGQRVSPLGPTSRLATEVTGADIVLSAAGTSSWELLCLGAACAFVCVVDNQVVAYDRVVGLGAVAGVGRLDSLRVDPGPGVRVLDGLLSRPDTRARLSAAGRRLVDGRGRERVADALARHVQQRGQAGRLI